MTVLHLDVLMRCRCCINCKDASATVSNESKTAMTDTASKAGCTIGQYIDISLYKYMTVNGVTDDGVQLHSTADKVKIFVQIPENLINKDSKVKRTYILSDIMTEKLSSSKAHMMRRHRHLHLRPTNSLIMQLPTTM